MYVSINSYLMSCQSITTQKCLLFFVKPCTIGLYMYFFKCEKVSYFSPPWLSKEHSSICPVTSLTWKFLFIKSRWWDIAATMSSLLITKLAKSLRMTMCHWILPLHLQVQKCSYRLKETYTYRYRWRRI